MSLNKDLEIMWARALRALSIPAQQPSISVRGKTQQSVKICPNPAQAGPGEALKRACYWIEKLLRDKKAQL